MSHGKKSYGKMSYHGNPLRCTTLPYRGVVSMLTLAIMERHLSQFAAIRLTSPTLFHPTNVLTLHILNPLSSSHSHSFYCVQEALIFQTSSSQHIVKLLYLILSYRCNKLL